MHKVFRKIAIIFMLASVSSCSTGDYISYNCTITSTYLSSGYPPFTASTSYRIDLKTGVLVEKNATKSYVANVASNSITWFSDGVTERNNRIDRITGHFSADGFFYRRTGADGKYMADEIRMSGKCVESWL